MVRGNTMSRSRTRRTFLTQAGGVAAGFLLPITSDAAPVATRATSRPLVSARPKSRVVIARDDQLTRGHLNQHRELLHKLINAAMQRLTNAADPVSAWRQLFHPTDRIGIKVNTLGLSTQPVVVDAIVAGLRQAGIPAENILIWDRFDVELSRAGFKLNKSRSGVQCRGTDAEHYGSGYTKRIESSGQIGSCFSQIVAKHVNVLISVPVLKDHNLAGVSLGMKNFYGAIHNPNKYHDNNCDPYIVDTVSHRYIGPKWKLTVCDATQAQHHAGPTRHPGFAWPFGGLILSRDFVAADAVATDLLETERKAQGLKSLEQERRPAKHILTAGARQLGECDLSKIQRIEV